MNEWSAVTLGECGRFISGGTPRTDRPEYWNGNIPWITASSLHDFYIRTSERKVTDLGAAHGTPLVPENTLIFVVRGMSLKSEFRIGITTRQVAFGQDCKALIPHEGIDPLFLAYAVKSHSPLILQWVEESGHGTGRLPTDRIKSLPVLVPPFHDQLAIAEVMGALDDKIELNRQMNETLENIARAIFKSWFVDFDPVRAKMEGRQPSGMDAETSALFPSSLIASPLGQIPEGWHVVPLPEILEINPTRILSRETLAVYLDMANVPTNRARISRWAERPFTSGMRFINGDVLLARITPSLENGKTALVDFLQEGEIGWGSTEFIVLRSRSPFPTEYAYFLARTDELRAHAITNMTGSSGRQRVPASCFNSFEVTRPSDEAARTFGELVRPLMNSLKSHDQESSILSAIRDSLMPRLIAGELRVKDFEKMAEAAL